MISKKVHKTQQEDNISYWIAPLVFMLIVGLYFTGRFGGNWAETDTAVFTKVIQNFVNGSKLVPEDGIVYPNGYSFQAISAVLLALTGMKIQTLQQVIYPVLASLIVLPAWVFYREMSGSSRAATLGTILLLTQPEFLFILLRSSHEKFTRFFMLLSLIFLVRSLRLRDQPTKLVIHVGLFYLVIFAFVSSNNLLAHSYIFALICTLTLGWVVERIQKRNFGGEDQNLYRRFFYAALISLGLSYWVVFFIYSPAEHDILVIQNLWDRIAALFLDVQKETTNVYGAVTTGWISLRVYLLVSVANWIILISSLIIWAAQGYKWLILGVDPKREETRLLWLFYAAFAFQGGLSIIADASGTLGSNLQHRLFPSFSLFAVGLVGTALAEWNPKRNTRMIRLSLAIGIFLIAILSVFKATNEPLLSNKWTFYRESELSAINWGMNHLQNAELWTEFDERLMTAYELSGGENINQNELKGFQAQPSTRDFMLSVVTRVRNVRLGQPLPVPVDALRIYDNGEAELYHLRPDTPFQK